jgi:hypothetical protein
MPAAAPARRGLPVWAIVLLSLAGLCAIGCVASFALLSYFGQQATTTLATAAVELATAVDETTEAGGGIVPTLDAIPTLEAIPTIPIEKPTAPVEEPTAAPTSGGGGIVGGVGSGSAGEVQTAQAATAEALAASAEIEQLLASAQEVFREDFADNSNVWATGQISDIETDLIEDGVIKIIWSGKGTTYEPWVEGELTNFIATADCRVAAGGTDGSCGLIFGQRDDVGYFAFNVYPDYYSLSNAPAGGEVSVLLEGDPAEFYRTDDWNQLRVIRQGEQIRIFLNDILLGSATDASLPTGRVGLSSGSFNEAGGVEIWLDNFVIGRLP